MMQNGVTLHENSKRETYAFNAKCSTTPFGVRCAPLAGKRDMAAAKNTTITATSDKRCAEQTSGAIE